MGAGSVVTRNIRADVFAAGNPCRVVRSLKATHERHQFDGSCRLRQSVVFHQALTAQSRPVERRADAWRLACPVLPLRAKS